MKQSRRASRRPLILAIVVALFASASVLASVMADGGSPTKGPIPPEAILSDGSLNASLVPDFVPVLDRSGEPAGYVSALEMGLLPNNPPGDEAVVVYAEDLQTVVGHMVPGRGFVALGEDVDSVPTFEIGTHSE